MKWQIFCIFLIYKILKIKCNDNSTNMTSENQTEMRNDTDRLSMKYKDPESKTIDYDYYKNFNLTAELEKKYKEMQGDKNSSYYENADKIDSNYKRKKTKSEELEDQQWNEKIEQFSPESLVTTVVERGTTQIFYEEILVSTNATLAFYLHDEESKMDFEIISPNGITLYRGKNKNRVFHDFQAYTTGAYAFHLINDKYKVKKKVTFALHSGSNIDRSLDMEHLSQLYSKIDLADSKMKEFAFANKMLARKIEGHFEIAGLHNGKIFWYSIMETILMVVILIIQLLYIKNLLNKYSS
jgi:hypothetical protein